MVLRNGYLQKLHQWKDEQVIKVVTGVRRCGKSTLLKQYQNLLKQEGVKDEQIISVNFEDLEFEELLDYKKLYQYLKAQLLPDQQTYIFLDEVQQVPEFAKVVDSIYVKENVDVYITGSNAYMLSSDLATLLSGRYVEIRMLPLSFREYCEATGRLSSSNENSERWADLAFAEYLRFGGLPYTTVMEKTEEKINTYLEGIYNTVIVRDIEERQKRKETDPDKRKISDITLLKTIARYLASVIGSPVSTKSVTDYLISSGRKISANTVDDYLSALSESFIFYPVERFDIVGKHLLKVNRKFYMVDLGLRNHILPRKNYDLGFSIENIVYFELFRRGYEINIGKLGTTEVDFVARKDDTYCYFQITADMMNKDTFEREMRPLRAIRDNYEKSVLTLDRFSIGNYEGIRVVNVIDWLLECNPTV